MTAVARHLRKVAQQRVASARTDGEHLECFVKDRNQDAFAALVERHGAMVLGVCRRVLGNHHDAEDAFQATFLVLARKAAALTQRVTVGNWLYGVAYHTALKARDAVYRRRDKERQVAAVQQAPSPSEQELLAVLDQELSQLPDRYREPIVLCDLEGKTRKEAARQLGWPEGTVAGQVARGRRLLEKRLTRRGFTLAIGTLGALVAADRAAAAVPPVLVSTTIQAASAFAAGSSGTAGVISAPVSALAKGVLQAMLIAKLKSVFAAGLIVTAVAAALGCLAYGPSAAGRDAALAQAPGSQSAPAQPAFLPKENPGVDGQKDDTTAVDKAKTEVQRLMDQLKREERLQTEGLIAPATVEETRMQALTAQVKLSRAEKNTAAALERQRMLIKVHEDQVARYQRLVNAGADAVHELEEATVALAEARIREGLYTILMVRERDWARAEKLYEKAAISKADFTQTRARLDEIRDRIQVEEKR
jgi:RNA polymerase sigma factor (sigma-70 family)